MKPRYSVVIPIFNESETILELWKQLRSVLDQLADRSEIIFVDDGSFDDSADLVYGLIDRDPEVRLVQLSRNFGHQCALAAGIDHAQGDAVILMDGDLQDAPSAILSFVEKWQQGFQVVYAIRRKRKEFILKRIGFRLFYRLLNYLSGLALPLDAGIFSLMDRKVVLALKSMPERNRYLSGLRAYTGFKQTGIIVERGPRYSGEPRVRLSRLFKLAFDGIFSFSVIPLRITVYVGLLCALVSFLLGAIGLYRKFVVGQSFLDWAHGLTTTFFMGGIQLVFLGILGEYIGRIYDEVKQRPYYLVGNKVGFEEQDV